MTFLRHFVEMTVAMLLGMAAYVAVVGIVSGAFGSTVEGVRLGAPVLYALGMGASMAVPMVAWMRHRGHSWRLGGEMTAAMLVPAGALIVGYWLGFVRPGGICPIACAAMFPAMVVAMLYRRTDYARAHA